MLKGFGLSFDLLVGAGILMRAANWFLSGCGLRHNQPAPHPNTAQNTEYNRLPKPAVVEIRSSQQKSIENHNSVNKKKKGN